MPRQTGKTITNADRRSAKVEQVQAPDNDRVNLGSHPFPPHPFGEAFQAKDGYTENAIFHRALLEQGGKSEVAVTGIREMLVRHHVPELAKEYREAMEQLGFGANHYPFRRFPTNPVTRKGNLAEIVLAEYLVAAANIKLPIYRLHYNPNIDQAMKGDDVLAFDLDANPIRVIVGEAKYRATSSAKAVKEIVDGLIRSYKSGIPASLQFIADRLFQAGQIDLGTRVFQCGNLIKGKELKIDYVGLLLSDTKSAERVNRASTNSLRRLVLISLGIETPDKLVDDCFLGLE